MCVLWDLLEDPLCSSKLPLWHRELAPHAFPLHPLVTDKQLIIGEIDHRTRGAFDLGRPNYQRQVYWHPEPGVGRPLPASSTFRSQPTYYSSTPESDMFVQFSLPSSSLCLYLLESSRFPSSRISREVNPLRLACLCCTLNGALSETLNRHKCPRCTLQATKLKSGISFLSLRLMENGAVHWSKGILVFEYLTWHLEILTHCV